ESDDFGFETSDLFLLFPERAMGLRELRGELLLPVFPLPAGGLRFGLAGFEVARDFRKVLRESRGSVRLGFKRGLCPGDFGLEFEFASLQRLVGGPNGRLQPVDLLGPLRVFSVSILEQLASLVEFFRVRLLSRLFPSRELLLLLLVFLLGFLAAQFSGLARAFAKFVDFVLEAPDLPLFVLERTSRLREFGAKCLFLILNLAARSVGLRPGGLQGSHRLRQVLS